MQLTNREIYEAWIPLQKILESKLPVRISYEVALLANKLREQVNIIEDVRLGLVSKYGELENGKPLVKPDSQQWSSFEKELNELFDEEVAIHATKVTLPRIVYSRCSKCNEMTETVLQLEPNVFLSTLKIIGVE